MARKEKLKVNKVLQISQVVRDIQKTMESYWNIFGIGPWHVLTFQSPAMTNTRVRGKPVEYSMKVAIAHIGNIQWELIQPLTGQSIYQEFLDQKGEGLHHIACDVGDYDQATSVLKQHGIGVLMSGELPGETYAYMDTGKQVGTIIEIYNRQSGFKPPPPESTYPPSV